jgi:hypothetical protein
MGNWQLEVGKFAFYVFAPVMSFYIYHRVSVNIFWSLRTDYLKINKT